MPTTNWTSTVSELFFSRHDNEDLRWGDFAQSTQSHPLSDLNNNLTSQENKKNPSVGIWGYADENGIALNNGRLGAHLAPAVIRHFFYRLTPPSISIATRPFLISDYGDWTSGPTLTSQIELISPLLAQLLQCHPMITLGGGHDYGAVDGAGFMQWHLQHSINPNLKPLIINFDAHLDVRPWKKGLSSGTSFSWLLDHYPNQFELVEVGIQNHCASPHHREWLQTKQVPIIDLPFIRKVGMIPALQHILAGTSSHQPCYISLDIDVFSQSYAPGCSQSWGAGFVYEEMETALSWLLSNKNVRLLGVYEVSPPLDIDGKTSKLAACMMNSFIKNYWTK